MLDRNVVVGIPAYNEEVAIGSMVIACRRYADEVVVADDGSRDQTATIARAAGATVLQHPENAGKGNAVKTILSYCREKDVDALVLIDGDGQHLPEDIPAVAGPVLDADSDVVIGSRYLDESVGDTPTYRRIGQRTLDALTFGSTGTGVSDSQSGFRALSPTAIDRLTLRTDGMGIESEMISSAAQHGLDIAEVPIAVRYEGVEGQTLNPLRHGLDVVTFLLQLVRDNHPLLFFGLPGFALICVGTVVGTEAILIYQQRGVFLPAYAMIAGFSTLLGTLGMFTGLILNRIAHMFQRLEEEQ